MKYLNIKTLGMAGIIISALFSCKNESANYTSFISPETGARISSGQEFTARMVFAGNTNPDSVTYFIDSVRIGAKKDTSGISVKTAGLALGNHVLSAKIFSGTDTEDVTTNIVILAAQAPIEHSFKIVNTFPHDPASYVEGLEYHDGFIYESSGQRKESKLRKANLTNGKVVQSVKLEDQYFGEGMTVIGNKIVMLTYEEHVGFVFDKSTFKKLAEFPYPGREGWGLCFDGTKILNTDGSSFIFFLDKDNYRTTGSMEVYDHNGPVRNLNELEFIEGKIYANVYDTTGPYANKILIIDPKSGAVESTINLVGLNPVKDKPGDSNYILNGIAWDAKGKRLFVTGKYWPNLFEIAVVSN